MHGHRFPQQQQAKRRHANGHACRTPLLAALQAAPAAAPTLHLCPPNAAGFVRVQLLGAAGQRGEVQGIGCQGKRLDQARDASVATGPARRQMKVSECVSV